MARGHSRSRSESSGLTVRSLDEVRTPPSVANAFRADPEASLKGLFESGDRIRLFDGGEGIPLRVSQVKDRSVIALDKEGLPVRLVLEKDSGGRVVGLKEPGRGGRRVA